MIDGEAFAAAVVPNASGYRYDFRMEMDDCEIRAHRLPGEVAAKLRALLGHFGLVYGAIDMRLTPEGDYVFLEVNPAGQWLFIEVRTGQPITAALCRYMVERDGESRAPVSVADGGQLAVVPLSSRA